MLEVKVKSLNLDKTTNMPTVILEDISGRKSLTIWIGVFEAKAMSLELEKVQTPRPMTHDLLKNIVDGIKAKVNHVVINDLKDNTFYAIISLKIRDEVITIDARPSDAIVFALKVKAPIYVEEKVMETAQSQELGKVRGAEEKDEEELKEWLENLRPEDF